MKRIVFILFFGIAYVSSMLLMQCASKPENSETDTANYIPAYNPLPVSLLDLDSATFQLSGKSLEQPMVAVFFNPGCEHCQKQAIEIKNNLKLLDKATIVMITSAKLSEIKSFSEEYGLSDNKNVFFTFANPVDVYNAFGSITVPYIVLYSSQHKKVKEFTSNAEVGEFLPYLN